MALVAAVVAGPAVLCCRVVVVEGGCGACLWWVGNDVGSVSFLQGPVGPKGDQGSAGPQGAPGLKVNCSRPPAPRGVVIFLVLHSTRPPGDTSPVTGGSLVPLCPLPPPLLLQGEKGEPGVIISPDGTVVTAKVKGEKVGAWQEWGAHPHGTDAGGPRW